MSRQKFVSQPRRSLSRLALASLLCVGTAAPFAQAQAQTVVNGMAFTVHELAGVGRLPASQLDEHGETFGSISGLVVDASTWTRTATGYTGVFYASPDRGYNVAGTIDYAPRINRIDLSFTPAAAGATGLGQHQIGLTLTQSTLLYEQLSGGGTRVLSGLDPVPGGVATGGARPATAFGGTSGTSATRDHTRLFTYDIENLDEIALTGEYVVELPKFQQGANTLVAAQSEILALSDTQLLILPRDSNGQDVGTQESKLRRVDVIDLAQATNILGQSFEGTIAPGGVLNPAITPVLYIPFLDINDNAQLARFGLVNGVVPGLNNLSEKWEGLALVSALDPSRPFDYYLFVANDNDFATTQGFQVGSSYNDGKDIDTMFLVYRVTIAPVPEPQTYALLLAGLGVLAVVRKRNKGSRA